MSSTHRDGTGSRAELEFERALVDAGRSDELPHGETQRAWAHLADRLTVATAAFPAGGGAALPRGGLAAAAAARGTAVKWLVVGALSGSVLTAGLTAGGFEWRRHRTSALRPADAEVLPSAPTREAERPDRARIAPAALDGAPVLEPRGALRPAMGQGTLRARPSARASNGAAMPSTLAAEVAALDAARKAAATGDPDATLRLLDRYRYDFPDGELAVDAEVVALEALAAKGDRAAVAQRAERFLARNPNDPHAAEVRRLARGR